MRDFREKSVSGKATAAGHNGNICSRPSTKSGADLAGKTVKDSDEYLSDQAHSRLWGLLLSLCSPRT